MSVSSQTPFSPIVREHENIAKHCIAHFCLCRSANWMFHTLKFICFFLHCNHCLKTKCRLERPSRQKRKFQLYWNPSLVQQKHSLYDSHHQQLLVYDNNELIIWYLVWLWQTFHPRTNQVSSHSQWNVWMNSPEWRDWTDDWPLKWLSRFWHYHQHQWQYDYWMDSVCNGSFKDGKTLNPARNSVLSLFPERTCCTVQYRCSNWHNHSVHLQKKYVFFIALLMFTAYDESVCARWTDGKICNISFWFNSGGMWGIS